MRLAPRQQLGHYDALAKPLVRQHRWPRHVPDRVVAGSRGLEALVDLDEPALGELNAALLKPEVFGVHGAARRHQHGGRGHLLLFATRLDVQHDLVLPMVALVTFAPAITSMPRFL